MKRKRKTEPNVEPSAEENLKIGERIWLDAAVRAQQAGLCPHEWGLISATKAADMLIGCAPTPAEGAYYLSRALAGSLAAIACSQGRSADKGGGEAFESVADAMCHGSLKHRRHKRGGKSR